MIGSDILVCPNCGGYLKYYDTVRRTVRTKGRHTKKIFIRRLRCSQCRKIHREIPDDIYPHKQYEADVIRGVLDGFITADTYGYEDYPCEATMNIWRKQKFEQLRLEQFYNMEVSSEFIFKR